MGKDFGTTKRLRERKAALIKKKQSLASFIASPLSPYHSFNQRTYTAADPVFAPSGETYHRSEKSPFKDNDKKKFTTKKLANGDRAHLGAYANNFERAGDQYLKSTPKPTSKTEPGSGQLHQDLLQFKIKRAKAIAEALTGLTHLDIGVYHDYPCLMVHLKDTTIHQLPGLTHKPSPAAFEAWTNLVGSVYLGIINYLQSLKGLDIEAVRRSSFGFNSPTIAPTGASIRINLGFVPTEYSSLVIQSLQMLDQALRSITDPNIAKDKLPANLFYGSKEHIKYLTRTRTSPKYKTPNLTDIFQLLWQQVEFTGKTTVQNIMRSVTARESIASEVTLALNSNEGNTLQAMISAIGWAAKQLSVTKLNTTKPKLSFSPDKKLNERVFRTRGTPTNNKSRDQEFWNTLNKICDAYARIYHADKDIIALTKELKQSAKTHRLNRVYARLELLNEFMLVNRLETYKPELFVEDGFGSESEEDKTVGNTQLYHKKVIVSNGMRAISAAVRAISELSTKSHFYIGAAYYEVSDCLKLTKSTYAAKYSFGSKPYDLQRSTAAIVDLNPCVTDASPNEQEIQTLLKNDANKILILDTTSTLPSKINAAITQFSLSDANILILVSSGLKQEQNAADRNAYGTIRVIAKDQNLLQLYIDRIKKNEPNVNSPFSHFYRRSMKNIGAVPTISSILNATPAGNL